MSSRYEVNIVWQKIVRGLKRTLSVLKCWHDTTDLVIEAVRGTGRRCVCVRAWKSAALPPLHTATFTGFKGWTWSVTRFIMVAKPCRGVREVHGWSGHIYLKCKCKCRDLKKTKAGKAKANLHFWSPQTNTGKQINRPTALKSNKHKNDAVELVIINNVFKKARGGKQVTRM